MNVEHGIKLLWKLIPRLFVLSLLLIPETSIAHVKWFSDYDIRIAPRSPWLVFSGSYFLVYSLVLFFLIIGITYADRLLMEKCYRYLSNKDSEPYWQVVKVKDWFANNNYHLLRYGVSAFFFSLYIYDSFILTPELKTGAPWVHWAHLCISILALNVGTVWIAATFILALYGQAIAQYGMFHMLDYPIFIGVAFYLLLWSRYGAEKRVQAEKILTFFTAITLLWGGVEKFCYPEWSFGLLYNNPELLLGFTPEFYMVSSGFVEFTAAYLLITGKLSARIASMLLLSIFLAAIVIFGRIDAVGHSVIIVVLMMMTLGSANQIASMLDTKNHRTTAVCHAVAYVLTLVGLVYIYCGMHHLFYPAG